MSDKNKLYNISPDRDIESFKELFYFYFPRLKSYAHRLLQDPDVATDLVQDVFLQLWENKEQLDYDNNISSYIFTLVKNKCLNFLKHKVVEEKFVFQAAFDKTGELYHISFLNAGEYSNIDDILISELEIIISEMPEKCEKAFRLKWFEGKKIREIAQVMNVSTTMVDKYLAKGMLLVRRKLDPDMFVFFLMDTSDL